jgi:hypothetical protein
MIEIRELVIKATVDGSNRDNNVESSGSGNGLLQNERKGCCQDTVDMILQIIKDKKER